MAKKNINIKERLILALDLPNINQAKKMVELLSKEIVFYKIGLELLMTENYFSLIKWLKEKNKKIFADVKLFDIPQTVYKACKNLIQHNIDFISVHGNNEMLKAACKASKEAKLSNQNSSKILAVTALTSLDKKDIENLGFKCEIENLVISRAKEACKLGCDGIISSGLELTQIRKILKKIIIVSPGIRPVENKEEDDQKRTVSVKQALNKGADYIVIGRPITQSSNPKLVAKEIQNTIKNIVEKKSNS